MRCRSRIVPASLVLTVLGLIGWLIFGEPRYHWRTITSWLAEYGNGPKDYRPSPAADEALRHFGPKAVPYLLKLLESTNGFHTTRLVRKTPASSSTNGMFVGSGVLQSQSVEPEQQWMKWVARFTPFRVERTMVPASWNHWKAYLAFQALGPSGRSAMPELGKMAYQNANDNSNPSGTGMPPNVGFWKNTEQVAIMVGQSSTYAPPLQSPTSEFSRPRRNVLLVDGEIAAWSLAAIGAESVPTLMELLTNSNPRLRGRAVIALGLIGPPAEVAVPALVRKLQDANSDVRWQSADALGSIRRQPELVVPALTKALNDSSVAMKFTAMASLGNFGNAATNAIPALLAQLPAGDARIGNYAALAISKISHETTKNEVLPFLLARIKEAPDEKLSPIRYITLETLGQIRGEPEAVIPVLIQALDATNALSRNTAIFYLGEFGPVAKAAVPKLATFTASTDTNLCKLALDALEKISPREKTGR